MKGRKKIISFIYFVVPGTKPRTLYMHEKYYNVKLYLWHGAQILETEFSRDFIGLEIWDIYSKREKDQVVIFE